MAAGYLFGLVVLIGEWIHYFRKNRKHISLKERMSFLLFWRSERLQSFLANCFRPIVAPLFRIFKRGEIAADQGSNYSSFKKYDSRILGVQEKNNGIDNLAYHSDLQLNWKGRLEIHHESRSLPILDFNPNGNQEVHEGNHYRRKDLDIVFGSINSLPWDFSNTVHRRNSRTLDSIQSY